MDPAGAQWFSTLGVGGAIAGFMFILYRKDVNRYTELWEQQSAQNREALAGVLSVIRDNTAALTKMQALLEHGTGRNLG